MEEFHQRESAERLIMMRFNREERGPVLQGSRKVRERVIEIGESAGRLDPPLERLRGDAIGLWVFLSL
jgi:hypothetical protein